MTTGIPPVSSPIADLLHAAEMAGYVNACEWASLSGPQIARHWRGARTLTTFSLAFLLVLI